MITTRRAASDGSVMENRSVSSGIDLLERRVPSNFEEYSAPAQTEAENVEEARIRMQRNLNKLLNYDRQEEITAESSESTVASAVAFETAVNAEEAAQTVINKEDDIRPTSTTMQFGDGDIDTLYNDMNKSRAAEKETYKLNAKGKIVVALYALAVTVILALIIINTGVLASIKNSNSVLMERASARMSEHYALMDDIDVISSDEHVIDVAENEYNMVKR